MLTILENESATISFVKGDGASAILSFAGAMKGIAGGVTHTEFRNSLQKIGVSGDIYFISDVRSEWYNNESYADIVAAVSSKLAERGTQFACTIGNSMGGFGAIAFAREFRQVQRCIAFAPQSSVVPEIVPDDRRWLSFVRDVRRWVIRDAADTISDKIEYFLFAGSNENLDIYHTYRMAIRQSEKVKAYIVSGADHRVAFTLKEHEVLVPIIEAVISGTSSSDVNAKVRAILRSRGFISDKM